MKVKNLKLLATSDEDLRVIAAIYKTQLYQQKILQI